MTEGNGPIDLSEFMRKLAEGIDKILNGQDLTDRQNGFVLLVFPFNDGSGQCNYISNGADREDMLRMFKFQVERLEERIKAKPQ